MSTENTVEFMDSLPRGPLVRHLGKVHSIARTLPRFGRAGVNPASLYAALEYSLREIAAYTAETPYHSRATPSTGAHQTGGALDYRALSTLVSEETADRLSEIGAAFRESVREGMARLNGQLTQIEERKNHLHATLDTEAYSKRQYEIKIERERAAGRAFITNYASKTRREIRARGLHMPHTTATTEGH